MAVVTKTALKAKYQTGDFPTEQDFIDFIDTVYPYEKYVALLTQTGTNAPVATVLENTLGGTVVWGRTTDGSYTATLSGAFTSAKTVVFCTGGTADYDGMMSGNRSSSNVIAVLTSDSDGNLSDNRLTVASIEIRVYP